MARSGKTKAKAEWVGQPDAKAALDSAALLKAAQPVLEVLTKDLLARADGSVAVTRALKARHAQEKAEELTADTYAVWRRGVVVQIAAGWLLSCVFVRTLEDRGLLAANRIAGEGAADAQVTFDQIAPYLTARDYLLAVFRELERYPATKELFDREHNLAWRLAPSAEAVGKLLELFRSPSAEAPAFRFGQADTRFLGDLYQDLSEEVRKRYALLQTPKFVEEFILDRTLEPAIEEFGLEETTVIDPTCGSGHFLLGGFDRLFGRWCGRGVSKEEAVERALEGVYGVDINPYATSIAKFRLTLSAVEKLGVTQIQTAPALHWNVATADSLLHNYSKQQADFGDMADQAATVWRDEAFALGDERLAKHILDRKFAAIVGNPPYITVKDKALRDRYRALYEAAYREYSLATPFMERFFGLGRKGAFVGQITANSFMKREFGKLLIERVLPKLDLTLIVNTAGAYIPGHGTPTVLIFGRSQAPDSAQVHAVLARRGEPSTPEDPARGEVWGSIAEHWQEVGFENDYITVENVERAKLEKHPWSLEGGGAGELKAIIEARAEQGLGDISRAIGFMCITKQDDVFSQPVGVFERHGVERDWLRTFVVGENVRDWSVSPDLTVFFPYTDDGELRELPPRSKAAAFFWRFRAVLESRAVFGGKTFRETERPWFAYGQIPPDRIRGIAITFAEVATHNHFVLDRGGKVFKQTAPIIKLPETATEDDHLALLAYLNSSTACFWMRQVCQPKGSATRDAMHPENNRYQFGGTAVAGLPLPDGWDGEYMLSLGTLASKLAERREQLSPKAVLYDTGHWEDEPTLRSALGRAREEEYRNFEAMVWVQEEIDWHVYGLFGLAQVSPTNVDHWLKPELRPFEWGTEEAPAEFPSHLSREYSLRRQQLAASKVLQEAESLATKRLWRGASGESGRYGDSRDEETQIAARDWVADRVEDQARTRETVYCAIDLVANLRTDLRVTAVAALLGGALENHVQSVLGQFSVPYLDALVYSVGGLEKRAAWKRMWELQRNEDHGDDVAAIALPPAYSQGSRGKSRDFQEDTYWRLRGKLDVPKERFISYPHCESDRDPQPIYGWAGWDHAQRAKALATLYIDRKDNEAWPAERLQPMLAGLLELLPWVHQWHPEPDPDTGEPFGAFLETWLEGECQRLGFTHDDLRAWRPPKKTAKKTTAKKTTAKKAPTKKAST